MSLTNYYLSGVDPDMNRYVTQAIKNPNFVRWFSTSVVVNDYGRPKPVFHGTNKDFTYFDKGDVGFHFGTLEQAEVRIGSMAMMEDGMNIKPFFLRILNPFIMNHDIWRHNRVDAWNDSIMGFIDDNYDNGRPIKVYPDRDRLVRVLQTKYGYDDSKGEFTFTELSQVTQFFIDMGYDGIIYTNSLESMNDTDNSYIVFKPQHIKSVFNSGTFSLNDKDFMK